MRSWLATVRPREDQRGLAPQFEAGEITELSSGCLGAFVSSGDPVATEVRKSEEEYKTGQELRRAIGEKVRDFKNSGTLLAWMLAQSMKSELSGPWRWVRRVAFEAFNATGFERPKRAVSFPIRRGGIEEVFQKLMQISLEEAASEDFGQVWSEECWLFLALHATSGLAGQIRPLAPGRWTALEERGAEAARKSVQRLMKASCEPAPPFEKVASELKAAKIGYGGEEVGPCESLTLDQISPALPPFGHGGSIPLVDLVSDGTRRILENPEGLLKEDFDHPRPKIPGAVHFGKGEKERVCDELVKRGICDWIRLSEVVEVRSTKVLNGLCGVKKPATLSDGRHVLRVIMNLKASNSVMHQIRGSVDGLPAITAWQAAVLECDEQFRFYQSDISSAFYLFELPRSWRRFLAFAVSADGSTIGLEQGVTYQLARKVLPMGMHSSVSLMQEVSEEVLWRAGLARTAQVRRGQPVPRILLETGLAAVKEDRAFWQVYLDNFMGGDKRSGQEVDKVGGQVHETVERTWKKHGILSADKKRVCDAPEIEELGALVHGQLGILGGSPHRFCKLVQATLFLIGQKPLQRRTVQVVAGRWIHVIQFRRPAMSFLDKCWAFINKGGDDLALQTKREFLLLLGAIPLIHTYLGAEVDDKVWCSDASEKGGAVAFAPSLTAPGMDFVMSSRLSSRSLGTAPILVVGLFSGIGGTFRIYDILDVLPRGCIGVDIHAPANRVVSRRWPGVHILRDVQEISSEDVQQWARDFHTVEEVHLWGGFPCRDLCGARANRRNLEGNDSSLFFEFLRIWELIETHFPSNIHVKVAAENVASMDESASREISSWMGCEPYYLDCSEAVPLRRPRLCWTTENLEGCLSGVEVIRDRRWFQVVAKGPYPSVEQWITPGFHWPGEKTAGSFPTCMRAVWKQYPPSKPAGLHRADQDCRDRWALCGYVYPPYQFREEFLLWKGNKWWLTNSEERGLLMGYGYKHCEVAWAASRIKQDAAGFEREKCSLIGDSFSIYSFVIVGAALCRSRLPTIHYHHLCRRMGLAPGFRAVLRLQAPLARSLQYGCQRVAEAQGEILVRDLNLLLLGRANFTGSDVRVVSGDIVNPRAFPRQSLCADWLNWEKSFHVRWSKPQHINQLELRAIMLSILRGIRSERWSEKRIFHISDSYVSISVASKGRSSSRMLNNVLKVLNAHLLLYNIYLILAHVESTENPTDAESRR